LIAPKVGTSEALVVDFPTPMNYALLQRMLQVSKPSRKGDRSCACRSPRNRMALHAAGALEGGRLQAGCRHGNRRPCGQSHWPVFRRRYVRARHRAHRHQDNFTWLQRSLEVTAFAICDRMTLRLPVFAHRRIQSLGEPEGRQSTGHFGFQRGSDQVHTDLCTLPTSIREPR